MGKGLSRLVVTSALAVLFCIPLALLHSATAEGACPARGEFVQEQPVTLEFDNITYQNTSFTFSLPSNSTIHSATVDIAGAPIVGPTAKVACDFGADTKDYVAYAGTFSKGTPGASKPSAFQANQLAGSELNKISFLDGTYSEQYAYSWNGEYGYHHFKFKVPLDIVLNLSVTWAGYAGYYYSYGGGSYYGGYGSASAYIWNNASLAWEYVGNVTGAPKPVTKLFNGTNYLDGSGCVHVLSLTKSGWQYYSGYSYNNIDTDFVQVCATGNVLLYPKDPLMDIGANGRVEWSLQEDEFDYRVTVSDSTLAAELQSLVKNAPGRFVPIKFRFRSQAIGLMEISNFTVSYNAPPWCRGIPDSYMLDEDTPAVGLIDLDRFFDDDQGRLQYEITYEQDPKKLDAGVNEDGHSLDFKPVAKNWWGRMQFRVRATDPEDVPLSRESNAFNVTVRPVNDPPALQFLPRQVSFEKTAYRLTVSARDADMELDPAEKLTFSDNTSLFEIDPSTGVIAFTPRQDQVGTYEVQVQVTDIAGATDRRNLTFEVQDMQDAPAFVPVPDLEATQGQPFSFRVSASDPDIPYGDKLNFTDDCPLFTVGPASGQIEFTPAVGDVGRYAVTVTVMDQDGLTDSLRFNLTVLNLIGNTDRPPAVEALADQTAVEGRPFSLAVKASDPDIAGGDRLNYSDDSALFDIDASGRLSFTPEFKDAGTYNVTVTVKDRDGLAAGTTFMLMVLSVNHAPAIVELSPADGQNFTTGQRVALKAAATDLDGDVLNYSWTEGGVILGFGEELLVSFENSRTYFITLKVSDGKLEASQETSVVVLDPPVTRGILGTPATPGFDMALLLAALAGAALALAWRRRA